MHWNYGVIKFKCLGDKMEWQSINGKHQFHDVSFIAMHSFLLRANKNNRPNIKINCHRHHSCYHSEIQQKKIQKTAVFIYTLSSTEWKILKENQFFESAERYLWSLEDQGYRPNSILSVL